MAKFSAGIDLGWLRLGEGEAETGKAGKTLNLKGGTNADREPILRAFFTVKSRDRNSIF